MADPKSWNPWHGCRRYSEGCKFCYMFVLDKAHHVPESSTEIVRTKMFGKPKYKLYHPVDGHLLEEGELMVPRFNIHRCLECTSAPLCVGCTDCGSCKQVELVSKERLHPITNY